MYVPSDEILDKYADVLVNFALNGCKGIKKGDVVFVSVPECAKPMLISLRRSILKAGGHPILQFSPDNISREFFELASEEQLDFFPGKLLKGKIDEIDHSIFIEADSNPRELEGIDSKKIMRRSKAFKPYMDWKDEKENQGKFSWTIALYGTESMAKEANLSLEEYWGQIIRACFLDEKNPVEKWKETISEIERIRRELNKLDIEKLNVKADKTDLWVGIGRERKWLGGRGANIPSFEIYISPDFRITEGHIQFTEPLYSYGNLIENVYLEFKRGEVIKATASKGQEVLLEIINSDEGSKRIGEFSLTDSRLSKIDKFMATTLFDENVGKEFGNTHLALGKAYQDSYTGDVIGVSREKWKEMGFNDSSVHTDIVSTSNRTVTAHLTDGTEKVIYKDGMFTV